MNQELAPLPEQMRGSVTCGVNIARGLDLGDELNDGQPAVMMLRISMDESGGGTFVPLCTGHVEIVERDGPGALGLESS